MLRFIKGRAGSGKTHELRERLAKLSLAGDDKLVMIVPEQYSFETEKAMLRLCGAQHANQIRVYSFTRLAEAVFRKEGGAAGRRLSDGGRRILMSTALMECEDELEVYKKAAKSGRLTDLMLTAVNEMKMCGITPMQLSDTAQALTNSGLSEKVREIALIYGAFEALVAASYLDSRDDLTRLALALRDSDFFSGCTVAVDSFEGFTVQERAVLTEIMRKADSVTVSLCTDDLDQDETGIFALVNRTCNNLTRDAKEYDIGVENEEPLTGGKRFENENLAVLEAHLFTDELPVDIEDHDGIEIYEARDVYDEAEYVAATICRLVEEKGYRYRDFSVICRSAEPYYAPLGVVLKKRGIPCFVSQPTRVDAEPIMRFVLGAFDTVMSNFATDNILEMLKTGLSGLSNEEISDLENYAFMWKISGAAWKEDFVRHPRGFGKELTDRDSEQLERLNQLRVRVIKPLVRFAKETADASGAEISQAVFKLLQGFDMEDALPQYCRALENAGEDTLAAKQLRVWDLLMGLLDQLHSILGERKTSRERYYRLLREVVSAEDVSDIPQTVDEVLFGTPEQVRQSSPKVAFLIGAAQGDFPLAPKSSGVFSDIERQELINEFNLPLGDTLEKKTIEERYLAYSVACAPSEMLFVSWPHTVNGEDKEPSELVTGIEKIFSSIQRDKNLPDEYFANTREAAFSRMAARFTENSSEAAAFRKLFENDDEYSGRLQALQRAAGARADKINDISLAGKLFGENMQLSPTQIENYHRCAFGYFCRYGLKIEERRTAEVDLLQYGTIMHYLFEKVFRAGSSEVRALSDDELLELVEKLIYEYAEENMGGYQMLSGREKYRLQRMTLLACRLIKHICRELAQSSFKPKYYELNLYDNPDYPPLKINDGRGGTVTVGGTIDRVDMVQLEDGREFVRVIDYKTGTKKFQLIDVLYGLNMQMLVYLAALIESGKQLPAGILYMPAVETTVSAEYDDDDSTIKSKVDGQLKMKGVVLNDSEIINAMEAGAKGNFIPAKLNSDGSLSKVGSSVLKDKDLRIVIDYSKRLIATMANKLHDGLVMAEPNMKNTNSCAHCPYNAVCGKEFDDRDVEKIKARDEEIIAAMSSKNEGGEL